MEYERIDKVQTGIISPSKLRLKLMGGPKRKDGSKSNSNSARTSPSKPNDVDFVKNGLLADDSVGDLIEEGSAKDFEGASSLQIMASNLETSSLSEEGLPKELGDKGLAKIQLFSNGNSGNSSTVHPVRGPEEDNLDYDSNASSSSFEFHKGQRSLQNRLVRSFSRPVPSKWNDAEKWIVNRQQHGQPNLSKKNMLQSQVNRQPIMNSDQKALGFPIMDAKTIPQNFDPVSKTTGLIDLCPLRIDQKEVDHKASFASERHVPETTVRAVSMRDMGTEMTPIPSQEPSRTATPVGATTPIRSPISSLPSTPRRGAPTSTPVEATTDNESDRQKEGKQKKLSEEELHLKTRREIVALGVQLGKMNIAAWASKDEKQNNPSSVEKQNNTSSVETTDAEQLAKLEYQNRAAAWEEAEKSKHAARFKREEVKIEAWESHRKAKLEAEMKIIEAHMERMRAFAHEKMMKKIAIAKQRSEEKRVAAEAKRNQQAAKTSAQADYIRTTGRIPSSHFMCCSWL